ncbi:MAG: hypothetical protein IIW55_06980 [Bacteroidales bacterium]|jgi:hypothetical protein|nr:hypothetical protein [Bacteroidales bacterium]MBQ5857039.1 hypothetical protein [Bacteroidales bacterium]
MKKKLLFLIAVFCFLGIGVQAQETMSKGQLVGSARLGLNSGGFPVAVAVDYGVVSGFINGNAAVSVGGEVGLFMYNRVDAGLGLHLSAAARGNFHYEFVDNLDTYVGLNLGILGRSLAIGGHLGARYYFGNWGLNLELGGGTTFGGSIGVSMKF